MCFCYPPHGYAVRDGKHPVLFLDSDAVTSVSMICRPPFLRIHCEKGESVTVYQVKKWVCIAPFTAATASVA